MESDEQLLQRMVARDEAALIELHQRYAPYLMAMARKMFNDRDEGQQIVQDTFVNAWNASGHFDPTKASAKTWLVTIAHRLMINRARGGRLKTVPLENWDAPTQPPDSLSMIQLREVVDKLALDERRLVELAFYKGYSHRELAELTGYPLGTVKAKLRSVLGKLRRQLQGGKDDDQS